MQKNKLLVAAMGALLALPALAEDDAVTQHKEGVHVIPASEHTLTSNVSLVSDYLYRGISQSGQKPAIQGGFDYARSSGFYAGVWGSSISWLSDGEVAANAGLELDTYLGFRSTFASDFSYDIGYLRYNYPGTYVDPAPTIAGTSDAYAKADTDEIYAAIGYKWVSFKYSYSLGDTFTMPNAKGTNYMEVNASYAIPDTGVTLGAHVGKQTYKGTTADASEANGANATYTDYKVSVSKGFSGFVLGLAYSDTDAEDGPGEFYHILDKDLGRSTTVVSLSRSF